MFMPISEDLIKRLMLFGLSKNEAKIYLALLQLKQASASAIAKLSNVPRQETYRVLPRLEKLGIVEVIVSKPTKFLAINPEEALSELINYQQEILANKISELRREKSALENELKKLEGKSAGLTLFEPVHYILISGQHLVNEKIQEMLQKAKNEVLWMAPKLEIKVAVIYGRDDMLRRCARRNVKVRIITEVDEKNVDDLIKLDKFCEIRHASNVTSTITIVDDKELIIGSAVHFSETLNNEELRHKLWTNDLSHINIMRDFFEKVWSSSTPAKLKMEQIKKGVS
ncbi:MAG: helix-turn-helix domain-containing protein [Candidatus Bathyarchaeia archaeon]